MNAGEEKQTMADVPDFRTVTVETLAAMVRERTLTAGAVTDHALSRIDELNPVLNAFVAVDADSARSEAAAIDARIDVGDDVGPLAGIPIGVKDLVDATGFPTSKGAMYTRHDAPATSDCIEVAGVEGRGLCGGGQDQHPRARLHGRHLQPQVRGHAQSLEPRALPGRVVGGNRRGHSRGHGPGGHRLRRGRVDPDPLGDTRSVGDQDEPGPGAERPAAVGPHRPVVRGVRWRDSSGMWPCALDAVVGPDPADLRSLPAPWLPPGSSRTSEPCIWTGAMTIPLCAAASPRSASTTSTSDLCLRKPRRLAWK